MFNMIVNGKGINPNLGYCSYFESHYGNMNVNSWKERVNTYGLFNFTTIKKVKPNTKYIVYFNFYHHLYRNFKPIYNFNKGKAKLEIPERIYEDSGNGLVHWIIDYGTECSQLDSNADIDFKKLCESLNTKPHNITLITGAETKNDLAFPTLKVAKTLGYNCVTDYTLFKFLSLDQQLDQLENFANKKIKDIFSLQKLKYKSLSYNRLPRPHRTTIVAHIIKNNYHAETLYSLGVFSSGSRSYWLEGFEDLHNIMRELKDSPPIYPHIKEKQLDLKNNQAHRLGWDHGLNSYFQLVTETTPNNARYPFITEKSLKPFAMLQPFIQFGPQNNVKNLKNYGYEIFDKWIDHSYDDIENDKERLKVLLKEFDRLQQLSDDNWTTMLKEMAEPLLHNLQLVKKPVIRNLSSQLIPILNNFLEN